MTELWIQSAHWGLALFPVLILLAIFVWLDAFKLMSLKEILILLLGGLGALAAWPVAGQFLDTLRSALTATADTSRRGSRKRSRRR